MRAESGPALVTQPTLPACPARPLASPAGLAVDCFPSPRRQLHLSHVPPEPHGCHLRPTPANALAHLPHMSEGLVEAADVTVSLGGTPVKLHSQVLASGSRVWCTALFECGDITACGGGAAAAAAAAVERSLEGHSLPDVQTFLRLLYDASAVQSMKEKQISSWQGVLQLASKLDAPGVLRVRRGMGTGVAWHPWDPDLTCSNPLPALISIPAGLRGPPGAPAVRLGVPQRLARVAADGRPPGAGQPCGCVRAAHAEAAV